MSRVKTVYQNQFPYHITGRCINKEWFSLPMNSVWEVFCEELYMTHTLHNLKIHSFVLMSNHYHLIASTPDKNISQCMHYFSKQVSERLTRMGNRINQTFAGRYYKCILHQPNYYLNTYKYNYRNPVTAKMCKYSEDYEFSTLRAKLGGSNLLIPILNDDTLFPNAEDTLAWLNTPPKTEHLEAVKTALKRQFFKSRIDRKSRMPLLNDQTLI